MCFGWPVDGIAAFGDGVTDAVCMSNYLSVLLTEDAHDSRSYFVMDVIFSNDINTEFLVLFRILQKNIGGETYDVVDTLQFASPDLHYLAFQR